MFKVILISIFLVTSVISLIAATRTFLYIRRRSKELSIIRDFQADVFRWSVEIGDISKRQEYFQLISKMTYMKIEDVEIYRRLLEEKFLQHIPSLREELRDRKLNQLLSPK
jgi:hypothetical protein